MFTKLEVKPATVLDAMDFAGAKPFLRKILVYQVRKTEAFLILKGGETLALAMFYKQRARRVEYAMFTKAPASQHMIALVRLAHLTLGKMADAGVMVFAHVRETDGRAQRMARLTGFVPGKMRDRTIWFFRGAKR